MQLTAIHHIAIIVSDYNRSKDDLLNGGFRGNITIQKRGR